MKKRNDSEEDKKNRKIVWGKYCSLKFLGVCALVTAPLVVLIIVTFTIKPTTPSSEATSFPQTQVPTTFPISVAGSSVVDTQTNSVTAAPNTVTNTATGSAIVETTTNSVIAASNTQSNTAPKVSIVDTTTGVLIFDTTTTNADTTTAPVCIPDTAVDSTKNWALGKVTSSSVNTSPHISSRAVDGNTNGLVPVGSCWASPGTVNPCWLSVDLAQNVDITLISIFNRQDCCGERLANAKITGSNNSLALTSPLTTPRIECNKLPSVTTTIIQLDVKCLICFNVRYITVEPAVVGAAICEIYIFSK